MNKKSLGITIGLVAFLLLIVFIGLIVPEKHIWLSATCSRPETCRDCGITKGIVAPHKWVRATCEKQKYCSECGETEGDILPHSWVSASCSKPKHCENCDLTDGETLPHTWVGATCTKPQHCSVCEATEGTVLDHKWKKGNATTPRQCTDCGKMEPLALPENGQIFLGANLSRYGELTIKSSSKNNCYIKLKNSAGDDVFSFFVRAGSNVTVSVPTGHYYVYFAYGDDWYGTQHSFGPDTTYAKDSSLLDFENYSWTYTLYSVVGGNFSETPINENEFN